MHLPTSFCMEPNQVRTGSSIPDTFVKMLQEVNRITAPVAYGIAAEYPTATELVRGFEREGKDMLMGVRKSANRDGGLSDRDVGRRVSRRLWGIFRREDEGSMDV
jgi:crossover junction endonuclease EME1